MDKRTNNDQQNSTHKTEDRATRTSLKPVVNSGAPKGLVVPDPLEAPCCKSGYKSWMNEEITGKCSRQIEHIRGDLWYRYSVMVNQCSGGDSKTTEVMTSTSAIWTIGPVASLLAATLYNRNRYFLVCLFDFF